MPTRESAVTPYWRSRLNASLAIWRITNGSKPHREWLIPTDFVNKHATASRGEAVGRLDHHAAAREAAFFRLLRQSNKPNAPRPVAKSGRAAGTGVFDPGPAHEGHGVHKGQGVSRKAVAGPFPTTPTPIICPTRLMPSANCRSQPLPLESTKVLRSIGVSPSQITAIPGPTKGPPHPTTCPTSLIAKA